MNKEVKELLSADDVGNKIGLSRRSVFRLKATSMICPAIKVGAGAIRWRRSDIDQWIEWGCCAAKDFLARKEAI